MNEQELRSLVERMVLELAGQPNAAAPAKAAPVTAAAAAGGCLDDITETDLRRQYLVKNPRNGPAWRSEERRVRTERVSTRRSRRSPSH